MKTRERFGRFSISDDLIYDRASHDVLKQLFGKMIIVEARFDISRRAMNYTAIADVFDECEEAMIPPEYEIIFTRHGAGPKFQLEISARLSRYQEPQPAPALDVGRKVRWRALCRAFR